jgi:hypothetical protein
MALIRTRRWYKPLPDGFEIYNELQTLLGKVVGFSVVLIKDKEGVTRYDTCHECVHRDLLGRKTAGVIDKIWYPDLTLQEGFNHADEDLSNNCTGYYEYYESH